MIFHFSITYRRPPFNAPQYSQYQFFLYETITEQREKGKTFDQIAELLNKKGYLSVRGKKFKGNHVHSIVKKKRIKDEKFIEHGAKTLKDDKEILNSSDIIIQLSIIMVYI